MELTKQLNEELQQNCAGKFAPYYYRCLGYRKQLSAKPSVLRSNGIYALFAEPTPVILKNEWFAGNLKSLYVIQSELVLEDAQKTVDSFGKRSFRTNSDHYAPDYERILSSGIPGLIQQIEDSCAVHGTDAHRVATLQGMKVALQGFLKMIEKYISAAKACKENAAYDSEKLDFIIRNCTQLIQGKPQTFPEALQLVWLCHLGFLMEERNAMALGRLDQYLYPFYKADIEKGTLTPEKAVELVENVFIKLQDDTVNICIGGQDPEGNCQINDLSYCILQAVKNCNVPGPNLSLRLTANTPDAFLDECLKVIGTGLGYPALMNDDVNIAALRKYGYAEEDIYNYSMVGCIENFITGKQPPWTDGRFDTPRYFDYLFNNGVSVANGSVGLNTGSLDDITSMADFMAAFEKQLAFGVEDYVSKFQIKNASINQRQFPEPFLSCFCYDCIGRGLDINDGGSIYPSVHGAALMGIGTTADALAAIEKVVFIDKIATLHELRDALACDFKGYKALRYQLLCAPKYGNNDDFVDKYAVWFVDYLGSLFGKYKTRDGGGIYIAAAANISNIHAGKVIGATPDGRLSGEPLSDAASPTYGRDVRGVTATIHSLAKPDYTKVACGSVVNQKFSPSMFADGKRAKLMALIRTYFSKGGQEIQINATSREVLLDAMEHPEKHQNLVVRVSGFSAFYVSLDRDVQLDILNRTQQE